MFSRKKKLFGKNVEPSCVYCRSNAGGDEICCALKLQMKNGKCRKYVYDPLKRSPMKKPELLKNYSEDDFKL